jgi:hypothetical protein
MIMMHEIGDDCQVATENKRTEDPASLIFTHMMMQAIADIQKLTDKGVIKDGRCVYDEESWPRRSFKTGQRYNKTFLNYYYSPCMVNELIDFFAKNKFEWVVNYIYNLDSVDNKTMIDAVKESTLDGRVVAMRNKERKERNNI